MHVIIEIWRVWWLISVLYCFFSKLDCDKWFVLTIFIICLFKMLLQAEHKALQFTFNFFSRKFDLPVFSQLDNGYQHWWSASSNKSTKSRQCKNKTLQKTRIFSETVPYGWDTRVKMCLYMVRLEMERSHEPKILHRSERTGPVWCYHWVSVRGVEEGYGIYSLFRSCT